MNLKKVANKNKNLILFAVVLYIKIAMLGFIYSRMSILYPVQILGVLGSVLIILAIINTKKGNKKYRAFLIADTIVTILIYIDIVYNRYFYDVTTVGLLKQVTLVGEVKTSVFQLLSPFDIVYFLDLFIFKFIFKKYRGSKDRDFIFTEKKGNSCFTKLFIAGIILSIVSVFILHIDQPDILETFYDKKYIVESIGDINYHVLDAYRYISTSIQKHEISSNEKIRIKNWFNSKNENNFSINTAKYRGKNLIMVQMEAFQNFVLFNKVNGKEITPNLNKISKECLRFDNFFYQTSKGGTSDAEFLTNVSLLPSVDGAVYYQYADDTYDSLAKELKSAGYYTTVMHSNRPGFWNRVNMYKALDFEKYSSENDYIQNDKLGMGLSDKSFLNQTIKKMKTFKKPFYSFVITLSSHFPFEDKKFEKQMDVGEYEGTLMGKYLKTVNYTDQAIGQFVNQLKKEGLWNNSIVVFYGDHYAIPKENKTSLAKLLNKGTEMNDLEWLKQQKVVMMMHLPEDALKGVNHKVTGEMDIYPTLAKLLGVNCKYGLGQDMLSGNKGFTLMRNGSWIDGTAAYVKDTDKVYDINTRKVLKKDKYKNTFNKVFNFYRISDETVENNLIRTFENSKKISTKK